jgi:hypothetical protein
MEDPEAIMGWLDLFLNTIINYDILLDDIMTMV